MNQTKIFLLSVSQPGIGNLLEGWRERLSKEELVRESRIKHAAGKKLFVASRVLLRFQLGDHLNEDPSAIGFKIQEHGKPSLVPPQQVEFNLSHSKERIALAIGVSKLGIDLEYIKRENEVLKIAKRFFTAAELRQLEQSDNQRELFFSFWTLKEAYIKALGLGLSKGLATFEFDLTDGIDLQDETRRNQKAAFVSHRLAGSYHVSLCELGVSESKPLLFEVDSDLASRQLEPL